MALFDVFWLVLFVVLGLQLPNLFLGKKEKKYIPWLKKLIIFHFILGFVFFLYTNNGGGDAYGYWQYGKLMTIDDLETVLFSEKGTRFMEAFNYFPSHVLDMSFFSNSMFFSFIGVIGVCCFFSIALTLIPYHSFFLGYLAFPLVFFAPNLHFWSSGIGKDTLLFTCIGLFGFSLLNIKRRIPLIIISLLLAFAIRPHVVLLLSVSFGLAYIFGGNVSGFKKIAFSVILFGVSAAILPTVMEFVKLENTSIASISERGAEQAKGLTVGSGSSIDISSYPFPMKVFTFLFRPLFFDVHNVLGAIVSIENLLLLILVYKSFKFRTLDTFRAAPFLIKGMLIFVILGTVLFSQSLGNLGIMIRMRNMFLPGLLLYCLWALSYQTKFEFLRKKHLEKLQQESE